MGSRFIYTRNPLKTFSIGFKDGPEKLDERHTARRTAKFLQTDHHEILLTGIDVKNEIDKSTKKLGRIM